MTKVYNARGCIRVGLLLDDQVVPSSVHQIVERLLHEYPMELAVVVIHWKARGQRSSPRSILFRLWRKLDKWMFSSDGNAVASEVRTYSVRTITLTVAGRNNRTLANSDLTQLREFNFDVLIQLGSEELPDGFLGCAKYGVWAFDYGGYAQADRELALFWNLCAGRSTYELVLRATTEDQHSGRVLYRCIFPSHLFSVQRTLPLDSQRRAQILLRCLSDLHHGRWTSVDIEDTGSDSVVQTIDGSSLSQVMPRFVVSWLVRCVRRLFARFWFREQWFFAYCNTSSQADIKQTRLDYLTVVTPASDHNYADPFLFEHKGKQYIFFEEYRDDGPGAICCAYLNADGTLGEIQQVLTRGYHLSYPFVFEWNRDIYLLPETQGNGTVEVYGAVEFPRKWELAGVLLNNVTAADPTILQHNGSLWLFAAGLGGAGTETSELSLFFSDSLFGEWHPHAKNPIVRDVRRARPAGNLFFQRGLLIRPGQDCSAHYGYSISLNKVEELSETDYREVPFATIFPDWMDGIFSTHTLNQHGGFTVVDARRRVPRFTLRKQNRQRLLRIQAVVGRSSRPFAVCTSYS